MKKSFLNAALIAVLLSAFSTAWATKPTSTPPTPSGGGSEATAGAVAGAAAIGVGVGQGGAGGAGGNGLAIAEGGAGGKGGSGGVGVGGLGSSVVAVEVGGDRVESSTPPVVSAPIPTVPTSCRLYLFGGGSTRDGAASGSIPIGNDATCLSIAKLNLMERVGGFTQIEKQTVACEVEGMALLGTCQNLTKAK